MNSTIPAWRIIWACSFLAAICTASFASGNDLNIRQFSHVTWGADQGAPRLIYAVAQTTDDSLWIGSADGFFRFDGLKFERYQAEFGPPLPNSAAVSLLALPNGDVWIGFSSGAISLLRKGHVVNYGSSEGAPTGRITDLVQDQTGAIWAASLRGLVRLENNRWKKIGREWSFPGTLARALYVDKAGTLWVATENSLIFLSKGARRFQATGIHLGEVAQIVQAPNGKLWMAETSRSVRPVPLHTRLAPPDDTEVQVGSVGILFTREGELWITTTGDGLRCVTNPQELKGAHGEFSTSVESYTVKDGLSSNTGASVFQDREGNIWVGTDKGLDRFSRAHSVDLEGLSRNPLAQPASIESLVADGQSYPRLTDLKLPAGTKNLQVNYEAVSLEDPLRIRFRYKLDGVDQQWQDVGARRNAFYANLRPGKYRFRVMAGNIDGIWNSKAAVIDFTIPHFWFQTVWFGMLCGTTLFLLLWTLYQLRVRQLERQFNLALKTRLDERVRIARELHDTLLQSFHGLMFQFQAARNQLPRRPESAMQALDEAILATEQALAEGRDAIHDLRPESASQHDLAELLTATGQELAATHTANGHSPGFHVIVEGKPQRLSAAIQDEVYRIGREVIRNAFQHAIASRIEVEIRYDEHQVRLRIRDDGKGIDPKVVEASGRPGHWGLPGIRERAQRIGARLEFWSELGAGTEVELNVPAETAYEKPQDNRRFRFYSLKS